jgi:hypothetical protein
MSAHVLIINPPRFAQRLSQKNANNANHTNFTPFGRDFQFANNIKNTNRILLSISKIRFVLICGFCVICVPKNF